MFPIYGKGISKSAAVLLEPPHHFSYSPNYPTTPHKSLIVLSTSTPCPRACWLHWLATTLLQSWLFPGWFLWLWWPVYDVWLNVHPPPRAVADTSYDTHCHPCPWVLLHSHLLTHHRHPSIPLQCPPDPHVLQPFVGQGMVGSVGKGWWRRLLRRGTSQSRARGWHDCPLEGVQPCQLLVLFICRNAVIKV